jgi:tape measure domain-containing protein
MADKNDIFIRLSADAEGVRKGLTKGQGYLSGFERSANASAIRIEGALDRAARNVEQSFKRSFQTIGGLAGAYLGGNAAQAIIRYSDQWKSLEGRLSTVTKSSGETAEAQKKLFAIAQGSRGDLAATIDLYTKLNQSLNDNQRANFDVFKITETFQKGLAITGESAANTTELVRQFAQGVSSDFKASAQEINSFIDGAPALAKAVSQYLGGQAAGDLKTFAKEGQLSAEVMLGALQAVSGGIEGQFSKMSVTVAQSLTQLDNAFLNYIGRNDLVMNSTSSLAGAISSVAKNFETIADVVTVAGVAIGGRLAGALIISGSAYVNNTIAATANALAQKEVALLNMRGAQAALYNAVAEAKLTGSYAASSVAATNLRNATASYQAISAGAVTTTRAFSAALALVGGPIGLAVTAIMIGLAHHTNIAEAAASKWQETLGEFPSIANKLISKNKEIAESTTASVKSQIEDYKKLVIAQTAVLEGMTGVGQKRSGAAEAFAAFGLAGREVAGKIGIGTSPSELIKQIDVARDGARKLQDLLDNPTKYTGGDGTGGGTLGHLTRVKKGLSDAEKAAKKAAEQQKKLNETLADMQGKLKADVETQSMDEYAKAVYDARLEIEKLRKEYGGFTAAQLKSATSYIRSVEAFQQGKKAAKEQSDALEEAAKVAEKHAEAMRKPFEHALEGIQNTFSDTFTGIFDGSINSAADAAGSIKKIFIKMAAEIATLQLLQTTGLDQVFASASAGGIGGVKGATGKAGGSVVGDVFRQGSGLLGSTGVGAAIDGFGATALPSLFGSAIGPTSLSAGLGGAPLATGALSGLGIGLSSLALPVAGIGVAALLSSVFKGSKPHPASNFAANLTSSGADSKLFSKHTDTSTAKTLSDAVAVISKNLIAQGINVAGQTVQGGVDNNRGFLTIGTHEFKGSLNDAARTIRFDPNGGEKATNEAFAELTKRLALSGTEALKYAANLARIATKGRDADAVLSDIAFVLNFDTLGDTPKVLTETEKAIAALRESFKKASTTAEVLGLSVEKVRTAEAQRIQDLLAQSAMGIAANLIEATSPNQSSISKENLRYATELRDLQAVGATKKELNIAEVLHQVTLHKIMAGNADLQQEALDTEKTRMEVAKELADRFNKVQTSMKSLLNDLTTGKYSNLDPKSNLDQVRTQVETLGRQAQLGDVNAAEQLSQLIPSFLDLSGQVNGFNEVYARDRVMSQKLAESTLSVAERQISLQQRIVSEAQMQTAALTSGFAGLQAALRQFGNGLTVQDVTGAAAGGSRFGARPALNQALAAATGFTGLFSPDQSKDQFAPFRKANPQLEAIIAAIIKSQGFATGGLIGGSDSGTDKLLARVTKGEFVMNPNAVRSISAPALNLMNATGKLPSDSSGMQEGLNRLESRIIDLTKVVAMGGNMTLSELQSMNEELGGISRHAGLTAARS